MWPGRNAPANIAEVRQFGDSLPEQARFEVARRVLGAAASATAAEDWLAVVLEVAETVRGDLTGLLGPNVMIRRAGGPGKAGDAGNKGEDGERHIHPHGGEKDEKYPWISFLLSLDA